MSFVLWLAGAPLWLSALLIVALPTTLAMLGPALVRRFVLLDRLTTNNEVAGFKFAVVGVVYAVLLGFAVIVVWEKFRDAENAVAQEAGAAVTLYRLSDGLTGASAVKQGEALRAGLASYLESVVTDEWPEMWHGRSSSLATHQAAQLYAVVLSDHPEDSGAAALQSEMLYQLDQLTQARRARLVMAQGVVPGEVWTVLLLGAFATVCFTFFFGTKNLRAQVLMTGLLALTIFMGLQVILTVNRPFTGPVSVRPEPLEGVLAEFSHPS